MKRLLLVLVSLSITYCAQAQHADSSAMVSKFRLSLSYGVDAMNPDQINDHIATSNEALGSSAPSIKSMPELSAALTIRPNLDTKILVLRGGYMSTERDYSFSWYRKRILLQRHLEERKGQSRKSIPHIHFRLESACQR